MRFWRWSQFVIIYFGSVGINCNPLPKINKNLYLIIVANNGSELPTIEAYDGDQYMPTDCGYLVMPCSVGDDNDIYDKVVDGDQTMIISKFAEIRGKRCESEKTAKCVHGEVYNGIVTKPFEHLPGPFLACGIMTSRVKDGIVLSFSPLNCFKNKRDVSNTIYENVELKIVDDEKAQLEAYELILAKPTTAALTEDPKIKERENYHTFYAWLTVVGICVISIVLCLKCCCGSCLKDKTMHYWKSCKTWFAAKMKKYANVPCLPKTPSVTEPLNAAVNGEEEEMDLSFYVTSLCS